jgi:hypothetical protein
LPDKISKVENTGHPAILLPEQMLRLLATVGISESSFTVSSIKPKTEALDRIVLSMKLSI